MRRTACALAMAAGLWPYAGAAAQDMDRQLKTCLDLRGVPAAVIAACDSLIVNQEFLMTANRPLLARMFLSSAVAHRKLGRHDDALRKLNGALFADPRYALAYMLRGRAHADRGDYRKAVADYAQCRRLDASNETCHYNLGTSYASLGNYARAVRELSGYIQAHPNKADAYASRGYAYDKLGQRQAAIRDYRAAIRLGFGDARLAQRLAALEGGAAPPPAASSGDDRRTCAYPPNPQAGIAACTRRIQAGGGADDKERSETFNNRAWWRYKAGRYQLALFDSDRSISLDPAKAAAYDTRGHIYSALGRRGPAIADFRKALSLGPSASTRRSSEAGLAALGVSVRGQAAAAPDRPAASPFMTWRFRNRHRYAVELRFFSKTRDVVWPGGNKVWVLRDEQVHRYTLNCQPGEKVCFGAWLAGQRNTSWGVGPGGDRGCSNCCHTCSNQVTGIRNFIE